MRISTSTSPRPEVGMWAAGGQLVAVEAHWDGRDCPDTPRARSAPPPPPTGPGLCLNGKTAPAPPPQGKYLNGRTPSEEGGGPPPRPPPPPPRPKGPSWEKTKFMIGKILSGHFWSTNFCRLRTPPPPQHARLRAPRSTNGIRFQPLWHPPPLPSTGRLSVLKVL